MGSGKSSFAIQYMNDNKDKVFVYVTPLLSEVDRIVNSVECVFDCNSIKETKLSVLREHLDNGRSVAITHSLFQKLDPDTVNMIASIDNTCLIIDETVDCYTKIKISKANIGVMLKEDVIKIVEEGDRKRVLANKYIKGLSQCDQYWSYLNNRDVYTNGDNELLISMIPSDIYDSVTEAFILTYNFEGTDMDCYLKFNGFDFNVKGVVMSEHDRMVDITPKATVTGSFYRHLINICDNANMNMIGNKRRASRQYPLSKSWYTSSNTTSTLYKKLGDNCYNFFHNITKTSSKNNMVTLFKDGSYYEYAKTTDGEVVLREDFEGKTKGKKVWLDNVLRSPFKDTKDVQCFVPFNIRATNDFADKSACAFLIDVHYDYSVKTFFEQYDIHLDNEKYALNTLIQWIWRSRIRKGEPIDLYIPSKRMRHLLMGWLGYSESEKF
jgi:hypothetical protein